MNFTMDDARAASVRTQMRFEGSAGEYFKIWIVNLALTIVTLGIFSAWAKVRNKRYFLGNTYLASHSFDYHASPWRILLGRMIALALLVSYSVSTSFGGPGAGAVWFVIFLIALPWLIKSSLRFNARNTSYRNVRFDFHGGYGGAFKAFIVWPVCAVITLSILAPLAHRARDYYNINNHRFGGKAFATVIEGWSIYKVYLLGVLFFFAGLAVLGAVFVASHAIDILGAIKPGAQEPPPPAAIGIILLLSGIYLLIFLFVGTYIRTKVFNLAVGGTELDGRFTFEATLSPMRMLWIMASNLVVTLVTLGLMYPWALVRQHRYVAEHLAVTGPDDLGGFTSTLASQQGAIGEEVAGFFDIDFGL